MVCEMGLSLQAAGRELGAAEAKIFGSGHLRSVKDLSGVHKPSFTQPNRSISVKNLIPTLVPYRSS
jgi:hypothetical protein